MLEPEECRPAGGVMGWGGGRDFLGLLEMDKAGGAIGIGSTDGIGEGDEEETTKDGQQTGNRGH